MTKKPVFKGCWITVDDSLRALAACGTVLRPLPERLIGVTGTNGKTRLHTLPGCCSTRTRSASVGTWG